MYSYVFQLHGRIIYKIQMDEKTTQWPKEKVQKDKQRSTKHTYKTKDRVTRTPLKIGVELRCSGRVRNSCSTEDTRGVVLVTNPVKTKNSRYAISEQFIGG
jgi:hypothetical protein